MFFVEFLWSIYIKNRSIFCRIRMQRLVCIFNMGQEINDRMVLRVKNQVRYYREYLGISQRAVARAVGITSTEMSKIERGVHLPNVITGILIARKLGVTVEELWMVQQISDKTVGHD